MNSKKKINVLILVYLSLILVSCDPGNERIVPGEGFHKIYDKPTTANYTAVDIKETDGGYIILGMIEQKPYLLKVDKEGNFSWDTDNESAADFYDPIPDILISGEDYFFICNWKRKETKNDHLAMLKYNNKDRKFKRIALNRSALQISNTVPLTAYSLPGKRYLLFILNAESDKVVFFNLGIDGISKRRDYFSDLNCTNKYPKNDRRCHFVESIENSGNSCYNFQCYTDKNIAMYPDCFRITTINPEKLELIETMYLGNPFIAMVWHNRESFSGARIEDNIVTFLINHQVTKPASNDGPYRLEINEAKVEWQIELDESKAVFIKTLSVNERQFVFFAGSANNNQILLYACPWDCGSKIKTKSFGYLHRYEARGLIKTEDGGLVILGTTHIFDQFRRICLFKLSKAELEDMVSRGE